MKMFDLDAKGIDELIRQRMLARIGVVSGERMYIVPVAYAALGESEVRAIVFHSFEGLKIHMIRENPRACLQIDDIQSGQSWRSVVLQGRCRELEGEAGQRALLALAERILPPAAVELVKKGVDPFREPGNELRTVMVEFRIDEATGRGATP